VGNYRNRFRGRASLRKTAAVYKPLLTRRLVRVLPGPTTQLRGLRRYYERRFDTAHVKRASDFATRGHARRMALGDLLAKAARYLPPASATCPPLAEVRVWRALLSDVAWRCYAFFRPPVAWNGWVLPGFSRSWTSSLRGADVRFWVSHSGWLLVGSLFLFYQHSCLFHVYGGLLPTKGILHASCGWYFSFRNVAFRAWRQAALNGSGAPAGAAAAALYWHMTYLASSRTFAHAGAAGQAAAAAPRPGGNAGKRGRFAPY